MPSSGSCITYKILNSLVAPVDSSCLQARQLIQIIHEEHTSVSVAKRYKIYQLYNLLNAN